MENETVNMLVTQLTAGGIGVWLINHLKGKLGSIGVVDKWISRIARAGAALVAALAVVGIGFAFDPTAGVLTVSGLTAQGIAGALWEWVRQYVVQQVMYRGHKLTKNGNGGSNVAPEKK